MKNPVLEDIKRYALERLQAQYGFVGLMASGDMAMLNSSDGQGNDILIKIEAKPE